MCVIKRKIDNKRNKKKKKCTQIVTNEKNKKKVILHMNTQKNTSLTILFIRCARVCVLFSYFFTTKNCFVSLFYERIQLEDDSAV